MQTPTAKSGHYWDVRFAVFFNEGISVSDVAYYFGRFKVSFSLKWWRGHRRWLAGGSLWKFRSFCHTVIFCHSMHLSE